MQCRLCMWSSPYIDNEDQKDELGIAMHILHRLRQREPIMPYITYQHTYSPQFYSAAYSSQFYSAAYYSQFHRAANRASGGDIMISAKPLIVNYNHIALSGLGLVAW